MFDDFIKPVNQYLLDLSDELLDLLTGGFYSIGIDFLGYNKDDMLLKQEDYKQPSDIYYMDTPTETSTVNTNQNQTSGL